MVCVGESAIKVFVSGVDGFVIDNYERTPSDRIADRVATPISRVGVILALVVGISLGLISVASAAIQDLKLPFVEGSAFIYGDETYANGAEHPSQGAIAFDMISNAPSGLSILAMGAGEARLLCTHISGAAVLYQRIDGYDGLFRYVHLDGSTIPAWITTDAWVRVEQGQYLGSLYEGSIVPMPGDSCWQYSTGTHLHLDLPSLDLVIDGELWGLDGPNDFDTVSSTNQLFVAPATTTAPTTTTTPPITDPVVMCGGLEATIVGTPGDDDLVGTGGPDVIAGLQGDDVIDGRGGDDVICGGIGDDRLLGGQGFDVLYGAHGNDVLIAAHGASLADRTDHAGGRIFGGAGNDIIIGSTRWDRMQGGLGRDEIIGFEGRDWIRGGGDNDVLDGGRNIDNLHGGNGRDLIFTGTGDMVRGGAGSADICDLSGGRPELLISCELQRSS
ncbi:MAG: hypothetical protein ACI81L_001722 [Verrucomicrobiales bacterium]